MFTLMLVLFVVVVWICGKLAQAASHVVESIGDPRERVAQLNGQYHQAVLNSKEKLANTVVAAHHSPSKTTDRLRSASQTVRGVSREAFRSASAEYHYRRKMTS